MDGEIGAQDDAGRHTGLCWFSVIWRIRLVELASRGTKTVVQVTAIVLGFVGGATGSSSLFWCGVGGSVGRGMARR